MNKNMILAKIILLQYFQLSIFNNKLYPIKPLK